jgi:hypothetical protein
MVHQSHLKGSDCRSSRSDLASFRRFSLIRKRACNRYNRNNRGFVSSLLPRKPALSLVTGLFLARLASFRRLSLWTAYRPHNRYNPHNRGFVSSFSNPSERRKRRWPAGRFTIANDPESIPGDDPAFFHPTPALTGSFTPARTQHDAERRRRTVAREARSLSIRMPPILKNRHAIGDFLRARREGGPSRIGPGTSH